MDGGGYDPVSGDGSLFVPFSLSWARCLQKGHTTERVCGAFVQGNGPALGNALSVGKAMVRWPLTTRFSLSLLLFLDLSSSKEREKEKPFLEKGLENRRGKIKRRKRGDSDPFLGNYEYPFSCTQIALTYNSQVEEVHLFRNRRDLKKSGYFYSVAVKRTHISLNVSFHLCVPGTRISLRLWPGRTCGDEREREKVK